MRILVIEDDKDLCDGMVFHLQNNGYTVDVCNEGVDTQYYIGQPVYDAIILDRMLPSLDGMEILHKIRAVGIQTPVIFVTAMDGVSDRIAGLNSGADDYLVKPFVMDELIARLGALIRRPRTIRKSDELKYSNITLDVRNQLLASEVNQCYLSRRENALMEYLLRNADLNLSRERIMARVWGPDTVVEDGNPDNSISISSEDG